ncbi:hypothetical protein EDC04DRAFT_2579533 [Pisolithus marmoratus]|nr:hypothetical protein EDC04DRAFT_2579533 [Pisolithus marmoratus]
MHFLGQVQFGVYQEPEDDPVADSVDAITRHQQSHVNHEAVIVPSHRNPFQNNEEEITFFIGLREVLAQDITPSNFGLTPIEWDSEEYLAFETIRVGCRVAKEVDISLAEPIWYSRACLWCQALSALSFYLLSTEL